MSARITISAINRGASGARPDAAFILGGGLLLTRP